MRSSDYVVVVFVAVVLLAGPVCAAETPSPRHGATSAPSGPWLPKSIVDAGLKRMVHDLAGRHKMDAKQTAVFEKQALTRWPAFLEKHRPVLQKIVNEYLEAVIIGDPPTAERVAEWAKALQPVMKAAVGEFEGTYKAVRKVLRPEQHKLWDQDQKGFRLAKTVAGFEVARLAQGKFDPRKWVAPWPKPPADARMPVPPVKTTSAEDSRERAASAGRSSRSARGGKSGPPRFGERRASESAGVISGRGSVRSPDAWESYVKQFIKRHGLGRGQANQAMAILKDLRGQAKAHEKKHAGEIKKLERSISAADPAAKPRFQAQLDELRGPVADLFDDLRDRLDALLTEAQREGGAKR